MEEETIHVETPRPTIRVAWLLGTDLRPYRIPFLRKLGQVPGIEVVCFHGAAKPGIGAPSRPPLVADPRVTIRQVSNRHWPFGGHRVAWQAGSTQVLAREFDVVVCPDVIHNLSVWLIAVAHRLAGTKLILFGFGYRPFWRGRTVWAKQLLRRLLVRLADGAIAYTERGRTGYMEAGLARRKISVANNTLDTQRLASLVHSVEVASLDALTRQFGLTSGATLIFVGRLLPEKRVDVLIEAFQIVSAQIPEASLLIVGSGPERDSIANRCANVKGVHLLGEIYDEVTLAELFMLSDLLVIPGRIGLTCVHGFSYGVPSVTTTDAIVPQSPEFAYIVDGRNGRVLHSLDPSEYGHALLEILSDTELLDSMKKEASSSGKELGMDHMVQGFVDAVTKVST